MKVAPTTGKRVAVVLHLLKSADREESLQDCCCLTAGKMERTYRTEQTANSADAAAVLPSPPTSSRCASSGSCDAAGVTISPEILQTYHSINQLLSTMDGRVEKLLDEHEHDFFLAYKTHMYTVQRDLKTLKQKAEDAKNRGSNDEKTLALEKELTWFSGEATRLDALCQHYKADLRKLKTSVSELEEDKRFLQDKVKDSGRQNKALRAALSYANEAQNQQAANERRRVTDTDAVDPPPDHIPAAPITVSVCHQNNQNVSGTTSPSSLSSIPSFRRRSPPASPSRLSPSPSSLRFPRACSPSSRILSSLPSSCLHPSASATHLLSRSATDMQCEIQSLRNELRTLKHERSLQYAEKTKLETFFLKCVEEEKNAIAKRRATTILNASATAVQKTIPLESFTSADRRQVLERLFSSEDVLALLFRHLFPRER